MQEIKRLRGHTRYWDLSGVTLIASDMRTCRMTLIPKVSYNKCVKLYWLLVANIFDLDRLRRAREEWNERRDSGCCQGTLVAASCFFSLPVYTEGF